jgi:hypothetical protein
VGFSKQDTEKVINAARQVARELGHEKEAAVAKPLESILGICCEYPELFPTKGKLNPRPKDHVPGKDTGLALDDAALQKYLKTYVNDYYTARKGIPVFEESVAETDPALTTALKAFFSTKVSDKSEKEIHEIAQFHRTCMVAENIVGEVLEVYMAPALEKRGWIWCAGETMRAVDFVKKENPPVILQIKNAWNSENSSSAGYRKTLNVEKWYRRKANGSTRWAELKDNPAGTPEELTEKGFQEFISSSGAKQADAIVASAVEELEKVGYTKEQVHAVIGEVHKRKDKKE